MDRGNYREFRATLGRIIAGEVVLMTAVALKLIGLF
jgi:hypothetical protein